MTIFFPLYYAFIWLWLGPLYRMPQGFYYLLCFSVVCELVFVWVPSTVGKSRKIHAVMAAMVGLAMFVLPVAILMIAHNLSMFGKYAATGFIVLALGLGVLMTIKKLRKYTFIYETTYCLAFLATISTIAHL